MNLLQNRQTKKLSGLVNILIGGTPSRSNSTYFGGNNLWCSIRDMGSNMFIYDTAEKITDLGVKNSNVKLLKKGTLLMSFKLTLGKMAFAGKDLYTNEAIAGLEIIDSTILDPKYLYYSIKNLDFGVLVDTGAKGKTLNKEKIKEIEISLPSLKTQQAIIKKLDGIFGHIDEAQEKLKEQVESFNDLKTSILHKAFKGELIKE